MNDSEMLARANALAIEVSELLLIDPGTMNVETFVRVKVARLIVKEIRNLLERIEVE